jgi:hypothetical protein
MACRADWSGRSSPLAAAVLVVAILVPGAAAQVLGPLFPAQTHPAFQNGQADQVVLADLNGDGALDVSVLAGPGVLVWLNDHQGRLVPGPGPNPVPLGFGANSLAMGDLDRDGDTDLIVSYDNSHGIGVCLGHGDGSFAAPLMETIGGASTHIAVADFDGDGLLDYAVGVPAIDAIRLGSGNGDGTFAASVPTLTGGDYPYALEAADLDADGDADLLVSHLGSSDVSVLLNDGGGGLSLAQSLPASDSPSAMVVEDLNGDAVADLVVLDGTAPSSSRVQLAYGQGDGTFLAPFFLPSNIGGGMRYDLAASDLDGDGDIDLAFGGNDDDVSVLFQDGTGFTQPPQRFRVGEDPEALAIGDLSGDGLPDLVAAATEDETLTVLIGDGGGQFITPPPAVPDTGTASAFQIVDLDADGSLDLVFVRSGPFGHTVGVMLGDGAGQLAAPIETEVFGNSDNAPHGIVVEDLDGDGTLDVCILDSTGDRVQALAGVGDGTFGLQVDSSAHFDASSVVAADLDGDGVPDLVMLHRGDDSGSVMLGLGGGAFGAPTVIPLGDEPEDLGLADLDGDGAHDLVVANNESAEVWVFSGLGDGGFVLVQDLALGEKPQELVLVDVDGDDHVDLCVSAGSETYLFAGIGNGTFQSDSEVFVGTCQTAADVDLDGSVDLVGKTNLPAVSLMLGDGQGGFRAPALHLVSPNADVGVADFDDDGVPDLLLTGFSKEILLGRLDPSWIDIGGGLAGTLAEPLLYGAGTTLPGQSVSLALAYARPGSVAWLVLGLSDLSLPFKGGTLVPVPELIIGGLPVDAAGEATLDTLWPAGLPPGSAVFLQEWVVDPVGPKGFAATNGVRATAQ